MPYQRNTCAGWAAGLAVALFMSTAQAAPCALGDAVGSVEAAARIPLGGGEGAARAAETLSSALNALHRAPGASETAAAVAEYAAIRRQQITALRSGDIEGARALARDPRAAGLARTIAAASAGDDCPEGENPAQNSNNPALQAAAEAAVEAEASGRSAENSAREGSPAPGSQARANGQPAQEATPSSGGAPAPNSTAAALPAYQSERRLQALTTLDVEGLTFSSLLPYLPFVLVFLCLLGAFRFENRRVHPRFNCSAPIALRRGGAALKTMVLDISRSGAKIRHDNDPISKGETVSLTIAGSEVKASVIWSNDHYSGLKFTQLISEAQVNTLRAATIEPQAAPAPSLPSDATGPERGAGSVTLGKLRPNRDPSAPQRSENEEV